MYNLVQMAGKSRSAFEAQSQLVNHWHDTQGDFASGKC